MQCPFSRCTNSKCGNLLSYTIFTLFLVLAIGIYVSGTNQVLFLKIKSFPQG